MRNDWQLDVSTAQRLFCFGNDYRDGFWFCEQRDGIHIPFSLESEEPVFMEDDKALHLAISILAAALRDPDFRGYRPRVI